MDMGANLEKNDLWRPQAQTYFSAPAPNESLNELKSEIKLEVNVSTIVTRFLRRVAVAERNLSFNRKISRHW